MEKTLKTAKNTAGHPQVYENMLGQNAFDEVLLQDKEENTLLDNALSGSRSTISSGNVDGGEDPEKKPDKVSDYNEKHTQSGTLYYYTAQGKGYYEGLVLEYFYPDSIDKEFDGLDSQKREAIFQRIWEFSPRDAESNPLIMNKTSREFGVKLSNNEEIYFSISYSPEKSNAERKYKISIEYFTSILPETKMYNEVGTSSMFLSGLKNEILAQGVQASSLPYDNSFPPVAANIDPQPSNRQSAFFSRKENTAARNAVFGYFEAMYNKFNTLDTGIDNKINKLEKQIKDPKNGPKRESLEKELKELNIYKTDRYSYPFSGVIQSGIHKFYAEGIFRRFGNSTGVYNDRCKIVYLGGQAGGINNGNEITDNKNKLFADAHQEVFFKNNPDKKRYPNIIGLNNITNITERNIVQKYIFDNIYVKDLTDTHFDRILSFSSTRMVDDGNENTDDLVVDEFEVAYSFTVEKPKPATDIKGIPTDQLSGLQQLNIFVKRIGKIGEEIKDPNILRINDVYGYSDAVDFVSFVTKRYKAIQPGDITGNTREEMIQSVNTIIGQKAETPQWYKDNYGINVIDDSAAIIGAAKKLNYYVKGVNEPAGKVRARIEGRTEDNAGAPTTMPVGSSGVTTIDNELDGLKPWKPEELKYLEMSFQKMSPEMLKSLEGSSYFRQKYNMHAKTYNQLGGITHTPAKYIAIYDAVFSGDRERIMGNEKDLSSAPSSVITHESAHVIQHTSPKSTPKNQQPESYGKLFTSFTDLLDAKGPTEYSRASVISTPASEFFPEAMTLFLHDPQFMHENFPKVYMWLLYLQIKGFAPSATESKNFLARWDAYVKSKGGEPDINEIVKIVFP